MRSYTVQGLPWDQAREVKSILMGLEQAEVQRCAKQGVERLLKAQPVDPNSFKARVLDRSLPAVSRALLERAWGQGFGKKDFNKM